ncbi:MAG: hypothetical protein AB1705_08730 [Verrucomicrobiota bacterium]
MKAKVLLVIGMFVACSTVGADEKVKRADVSDYPFYTVHKRGAVAQFVPGLNALLQLTDAQKSQIAAARDEMLHDEAVKAARGLSKSDPAVTAEQRDKARAAVEAATARLREKVAAVLTVEQKALIEKVNALHAAAAEETAILFESSFAIVKDDEAERRRLHAEQARDVIELFQRKLESTLTAEQKSAMARAAEEENQRLTASAKVKKPVK